MAVGLNATDNHKMTKHLKSPMNLFFFSIVLTIIGNVLYHIAQKSIPQNANPFMSLIFAYVIAIVLCLLAIPFYTDNKPFSEIVKSTNWTVIGIGLAVFAIEIGFLLAYRSGWSLSAAVVTSSAAVTILFVPIGLVFFKEHITFSRIIGIVFCILGLVLVTRK